MRKVNWNREWKYSKGSASSFVDMFSGVSSMETVNLPHDAMIYEECKEDVASGAQTGFFPGGEYVYVKNLFVPYEWEKKTVCIEFEGVYQTAMIYINGIFVAENLNGYSNFYVYLDGYLHYGEENEIKVIVNNSAVPNSRWYSGSGIYRNVNLLVGEKIHILADGIKITTTAIVNNTALLETSINLRSIVRSKEPISIHVQFVKDDIVYGEETINLVMYPMVNETVLSRINISNPKLWDCDHPELYTCVITLICGTEIYEIQKIQFGIRIITVDSKNGMLINGKEVKLRGACIHHDNGILGATTFAVAEERRCRQLKEAGFNSIRSAHHPISKEMLEACDKYGVLVMDELSDVWSYHKNSHDFATYFSKQWEQEVERMVAKDYNHPSVIMYSTGNEIPEYGMERGGKLNREICCKYHSLDPTRYTTGGINGLSAVSYNGSIKAIMDDILEGEKTQENKQTDLISMLNSILSLVAGKNADKLACHPLLSKAIEETEQSMDIIGLNYLTERHLLVKNIYPNKTVIGAETYPADIARLWKIVVENSHVLGDFTWAGYDYLGEAGCGIFHYDGNANFTSVYPERAAYIGDIDLIGTRRPMSYLREVVYGLREEPYIAVERVNRHGQECKKTAWMLKDCIESWTWPGYEGKETDVDVYSASETVELFLNGKSFGKKEAGEKNGFVATFTVPYEAGELKAVAYGQNGKECIHVLKTASSKVSMKASVDKQQLICSGEDLIFITIGFVDDDGVENLFIEKNIEVHVSGAGVLQGFGSANPVTTRLYQENTCATYDGKVMAVIRSKHEPGLIEIQFKTENCKDCIVKLEAIEEGNINEMV
ncbi:glycoside hydrolase family 2 TIM barrel-domain containing protein [Dorea sp. YH-dor228]|uniref:glycoside hydrolase family 2 protein n=1 Tax=Dorea sp. YH-dor228 TaxID=3151120 RepID=UPI002A7E865D|nr:DUF4982 domain-containing protein [bacterium]MDY2886374.1 glycoside hydrolase family 2 TIM barrel-domain containing protein [Bariatricus sp.]